MLQHFSSSHNVVYIIEVRLYHVLNSKDGGGAGPKKTLNAHNFGPGLDPGSL